MEKGEEVNSKYLRTLLRSDVYDRLESYAKSLSSGLQKWDFGVAIERLLDYSELFDRLDIIEARLDNVEKEDKDIEIPKEKKANEKESLGLLGGRK